MINNDILRRIRYIFDFGDAKIIRIFGLAELQVSREQISNWLKKDDDPDFQPCNDLQLATFLNGLIILKRGRKEGSDRTTPPPEKRLTNNLILTKLKIALNLKSDDILAIMAIAGFSLSKHELSAFFRKPSHKHYRPCLDQVLRNFLHGLQLKYRPEGRDSNNRGAADNSAKGKGQPNTGYAWKTISEISGNSD